jgi:hypothetical protein
MDKQIRELIREIAEQTALSPFLDIDLTVPVEVKIQHHGVENDAGSAIQWVSLPSAPQLLPLIAEARDCFEFLDYDLEEVWHSKCPVADTGLLADEQGTVSHLIDLLREGLGWQHQVPSLDKIILSKSTSNKVSGFHTDHFPFGIKTYRSRGSARRIILNLGLEARVVCFLIPARAKSLALGDLYCSEEYRRLGDLLKGATLLITILPGYLNGSLVSGVGFDAHEVLHSGLPQAGSMVAVITDWRANNRITI